MEPVEYLNIESNEQSHWWYESLHRLVLSFVREKSKLLDAGCGTGGFMAKAKKRGAVVHGIDVSEHAEAACNRKRIEFSRCDLNVYDSEVKYDVISCLDVLYHSSINSPAEVVKRLSRSLSVGGRIVLHEPAFNLLKRGHDKQVSGARRFRKRELENFVNTAGLRILHCSYRSSLLVLPVLALKLLNIKGSDLRRHSKPLNSILLILMQLENRLVRAGVPIPFGTSVMVVAEKT